MNNNGESEINHVTRELGKINPSPEKIQRALDKVHQALRKAQSAREQMLNNTSLDPAEDLIVQKLEKLSQIKPSEERTRQALLRVKFALSHNLPKRHKFSRRLLTLSGIAATILIGMTLFYNFIFHNDVQASLSFGQVIKAQKAYKGCYRIDRANFKGSTETDFQVLGRLWVYVDPGQDICIGSSHDEKYIWVYWLEKPNSTLYLYDPVLNTLRINSGARVSGNVILTQALPLQSDLTSVLDELEKRSSQDVKRLISTRDGSYERFDVPETFFTESETQRKIGAVTFWVDPTTKLIQKWERRNSNKISDFRFTYDVSPIRNVYDLGISPMVKVIDNRPTLEVKDLLARLESRRGENEQFGDYMAVLTNSRLGQDNTLQKEDLRILGKQKENRIYTEYNANEIPNLNDWPSPSIPELLEQTYSVMPNHVFVDQGESSWECWYQPGKNTYQVCKINPDRKDIFGAGLSLAGFLWPGPSTIYLDEFNFQVRDVKIVRDEAHPGLTGLVVDQWGFGPQKDQNRVVRTYWLDPARDDLSVEREYQSMKPDGTLVLKTKTSYLDFQQLPNSKWYPASWRSTTWRYENGQVAESFENENHLTIGSGLVSDSSWYVQLINKLNLPEK